MYCGFIDAMSLSWISLIVLTSGQVVIEANVALQGNGAPSYFGAFFSLNLISIFPLHFPPRKKVQ